MNLWTSKQPTAASVRNVRQGIRRLKTITIGMLFGLSVFSQDVYQVLDVGGEGRFESYQFVCGGVL